MEEDHRSLDTQNKISQRSDDSPRRMHLILSASKVRREHIIAHAANPLLRQRATVL